MLRVSGFGVMTVKVRKDVKEIGGNAIVIESNWFNAAGPNSHCIT